MNPRIKTSKGYPLDVMKKENVASFVQAREQERDESKLTGDVNARGTSPWDDVINVLHTHYHEPDVQAARALYAAVAAHDLQGQPVWPMAVAPPGSMKSELITALDEVPNVYLVDAVTPKTFLSGQIPDERTPSNRASSLLHRIGKSGVILIPDFSTVQGMKADDRSSVFAALRKIFDGKFSKEFGTAERVEVWEGRITVVVGTTPEIDRQRAVTQALGERFVMVRWPRVGIEAARRAIVQDRAQVHADLRRAVKNLLLNLPKGEIEMSPAWRDRIVALAEIAVRGRTHVYRHPITKELEEEPQPESPTRLAQQLCQLAKGSARLDRRKRVSQFDFNVSKRVAFDCIPPRRLEVLRAVVEDRAFRNKTSTAHYDCQDLEALGLLQENRLSDLGSTLFEKIRQPSPDFTEPPPRTNKKTGSRVGGTSRELTAEAGVL